MVCGSKVEWISPKISGASTKKVEAPNRLSLTRHSPLPKAEAVPQRTQTILDSRPLSMPRESHKNSESQEKFKKNRKIFENGVVVNRYIGKSAAGWKGRSRNPTDEEGTSRTARSFLQTDKRGSALLPPQYAKKRKRSAIHAKAFSPTSETLRPLPMLERRKNSYESQGENQKNKNKKFPWRTIEGRKPISANFSVKPADSPGFKAKQFQTDLLFLQGCSCVLLATKKRPP